MTADDKERRRLLLIPLGANRT